MAQYKFGDHDFWKKNTSTLLLGLLYSQFHTSLNCAVVFPEINNSCNNKENKREFLLYFIYYLSVLLHPKLKKLRAVRNSSRIKKKSPEGPDLDTFGFNITTPQLYFATLG